MCGQSDPYRDCSAGGVLGGWISWQATSLSEIGYIISLNDVNPPAVNSTGTGRRIANRRSKRLSAFGWYGGKFSHLDFLVPLIPDDAIHFCEVFGGSAAVLLNVKPYPVETYNDLDSELVNFFETLRDQGPNLMKSIGLTPFSREELARACRPEKGLTRLERAQVLYPGAPNSYRTGADKQ